MGFLCLLLILFASCTSYKKIAYFQGVDSKRVDSVDFNKVYSLQFGDIVEISVTSLVADDYSHFEKSGFRITQDQSMQNSYSVDSSGMIDLPYIGQIKIAGVTIQDLKRTLRTAIEPYLQKATINVRLLNLKISVLGEVAKPGIYQMQDLRLALPEALGLAGDLTILGKRNNVLIIREENSRRSYARLDLTKADVLSSPYYYLKPNDVIYVEPSKGRIAQNNPRTWQILTFVTSTVSLATVIVIKLSE